MAQEKTIFSPVKRDPRKPVILAEVGSDVIVECPRCQRTFRVTARSSICRCGFSFLVEDYDPT